MRLLRSRSQIGSRVSYLPRCNLIVPFVILHLTSYILHLAFSSIAEDLDSLRWSAGERQRAKRNPRKPCTARCIIPACIRDREPNFTSARHVSAVATCVNSTMKCVARCCVGIDVSLIDIFGQMPSPSLRLDLSQREKIQCEQSSCKKIDRGKVHEMLWGINGQECLFYISKRAGVPVLHF